MATTNEQRRAFIDDVLAAARLVSGEGRPIVPEVVAAQAALESRYGMAGLAAKYHNLFGIKAGKRWRGKRVTLPTQEWDATERRMVSVLADFKVYADITECIRDYADIIERYTWYADCVTAARKGDAVAFAEGLDSRPGQPGWATAPNYSEKILAVVAYWKLLG